MVDIFLQILRVDLPTQVRKEVRRALTNLSEVSWFPFGNQRGWSGQRLQIHVKPLSCGQSKVQQHSGQLRVELCQAWIRFWSRDRTDVSFYFIYSFISFDVSSKSVQTASTLQILIVGLISWQFPFIHLSPPWIKMISFHLFKLNWAVKFGIRGKKNTIKKNEESGFKGSTKGQHMRGNGVFKEDYEQCGGFGSKIVW